MTIIVSGRKQSGKNTISRFITCKYLNTILKRKRFGIIHVGKEYLITDLENNGRIINLENDSPDSDDFKILHSVKIYSFADRLKQFCEFTLGVDHQTLYGDDSDKNGVTQIPWANFPKEIRDKYSKIYRANGKRRLGTYCSGRELMDSFGSGIVRKIDQNAWVRSLWNQIESDNLGLSIISDARFPNEVSVLHERDNAKAIRLLRCHKHSLSESENAMENFALANFDLIIDNQNLSVEQTWRQMNKFLDKYFAESGLV